MLLSTSKAFDQRRGNEVEAGLEHLSTSTAAKFLYAYTLIL